MAQTIALLNMKGGVGKTILSVNLAWHFHQNEGKNVLLVDLDPQFNSTQYVMNYKAFEEHRKKAGTIADLLMDQPKLTPRLKKVKNNPTTALHNIRTTNGKRFDLLPAELALAWVVKNPAQMDYRLEMLLKKIRDKYDYVFIDCAPTDSVLTTMALTASDFLLIPMKPDRFSILGFGNLMETIKIFRTNCPDPHNVKIVGVVFTQVTGGSPIEEESMAEVELAAQKEGVNLLSSYASYSNSFIRSVADQTPIFETLWTRPRPRSEITKIGGELKQQMALLAPGPGKAVKK